MLAELEKKVADFAVTIGGLSEAKRMLLAVSGGADSMALVYAMGALKAAGVISADFVCGHINHQLRIPDSDLDEDFVVSQASKLKLPVITEKIDVRRFAEQNKLSIETAARVLRIQHLQDIAKANDCEYIATAHQKDDNAETVVHRLLRGTGFRGLAGISPVRRFSENITFVRPMLCVTRDEIVGYLEKRNQPWRIDRTNYDCRYKRNFLRHKLIPHLQKNCTNSLAETMYELSVSAQRFQNKVEASVDKIWPQIADFSGSQIVLDLRTFLNQPKPVRVELICRSLTCIGCGLGDMTEEHFERILKLSEQNISNKKIILPRRFSVRLEYDDLIFSAPECVTQPQNAVTLQIPGETRFGDYSITASVLAISRNRLEEFKETKSPFVEWFDFDKLQLPLTVRGRRDGDKFVPLGLASEKKVGKFLTLAKVSQETRKHVLIFSDRKKIIWVCPMRISEHAKITGKTTKILQLEIAGLNGTAKSKP